MFEFHLDRRRYFDMQCAITETSIIPFMEEQFELKAGMRVLEIGCGEGGVLKPFLQKGCIGVGVDLDDIRLVNGKQWLQSYFDSGLLRFISKNIYDTSIEELGGYFDIIVLKDVIEHIHDQQKLISWLKNILKPGGIIFFGFPPWYMPFGGHQQMCSGKVLSRLPYYHLLPKPVYSWILKKAREPWEALLEIKETGISIERFEKIVKQAGYTIQNRKLYLINPIYKYKFGLNKREQLPLLRSIPFIRNFFSTCAYYTIQSHAGTSSKQKKEKNLAEVSVS